MAGTTGTAREEAERLVATVLAMAASSGLGGAARGRDDDNSTGTGGLGGLLSGVVDQFLGGTGARPHTEPSRADGPPQSTGPAQPGSAQQSGSAQAGSAQAGSAGQGGSGGSGGRQGGGWHGGWATGSAECCVCPVCRAITSLRDPTPEAAERLAAGAGDFASGVASLLRAFSAISGTTGSSARRRPPPRPAPTPDQAWSTATRHGAPRPADRVPTEEDVIAGADPWAAATRAPRPDPDPATTHDRAPKAAEPDADPWAAATAPEPGPRSATARDRSPKADADPWAAATAAPGPGPRSAATRDRAPEAEADSGTAATGAPGPDPAVTRDRAPKLAAAGADPWAAATRAPRPDPEPAEAKAPGPDPVKKPMAKKAVAKKTVAKKAVAKKTAAPRTGENASPPGADPWAAATAASGDTGADTAVAEPAGVDHDVLGAAAEADKTTPAAAVAEDRDGGAGDDARSGDAV